MRKRARISLQSGTKAARNVGLKGVARMDVLDGTRDALGVLRIALVGSQWAELP